MLDLSDELDPEKPSAAACELELPRPKGPPVRWEAAPVGDSLLRLSTAVGGLRRGHGEDADSHLAAPVLIGAERGKVL